jgi:hypothetical protein
MESLLATTLFTLGLEARPVRVGEAKEQGSIGFQPVSCTDRATAELRTHTKVTKARKVRKRS